jgi:hypothetical protein
MTRLSLLTVVLLVSAAVAAGCASAPGAVGGDPNLLTQDQIAQSDARNVFELVEHLRPRWLQQRLQRSQRLSTAILVYHNRSAIGGIEVLRDIPAQGIYSIRWFDATQAGRLPGAGSTVVDGAIVISTAAEHEVR